MPDSFFIKVGKIKNDLSRTSKYRCLFFTSSQVMIFFFFFSLSSGMVEKLWNKMKRKISIRARASSSSSLCFDSQLDRGWRLYIELVFSTSLQTQQLYALAQLNLLLNNGFLIHIAFRKADPPHAPGFPREGWTRELKISWISRLHPNWRWGTICLLWYIDI